VVCHRLKLYFFNETGRKYTSFGEFEKHYHKVHGKKDKVTAFFDHFCPSCPE